MTQNFLGGSFNQFLMLKNDLENQNPIIFAKVVHNFGKFDDDII